MGFFFASFQILAPCREGARRTPAHTPLLAHTRLGRARCRLFFLQNWRCNLCVERCSAGQGTLPNQIMPVSNREVIKTKMHQLGTQMLESPRADFSLPHPNTPGLTLHRYFSPPLVTRGRDTHSLPGLSKGKQRVASRHSPGERAYSFEVWGEPGMGGAGSKGA